MGILQGSPLECQWVFCRGYSPLQGDYKGYKDSSIFDFRVVLEERESDIEMNTVVALRTHKFDAEVRSLYEKLKSDIGADRVYVVYDDTKGAWNPEDAPAGLKTSRWWESGKEDARALVFNDKECIAINSMHDKGYGHTSKCSWSFWHPETSAVFFHDFLVARNVPFDAFWFIEYDVRCHGSFKKPIQACDAIQADFMAKGGDDRFEFRRGRTDPWCWWQHIEGELASQVPIADRVGCFFPMTRYSKRFVSALREQFGKSSGFCEVYCSTLCERCNLVLRPMPSSVFAAFAYQPTISIDSFNQMTRVVPENDLLYHPVK